MKSTKKEMIIIIIGIITFVLLTVLASSFKIIPTGCVGVKSRFGKVQDTMLGEGINLKVPFIEQIIKINCKTQKCDYTMNASSKDLQMISNIQISLNYNVDKSKANELYKNVGEEFDKVIIEPAIYESVKQGMSQYTAEELVTKRTEVSTTIMNLLTSKLETQGILITALNITNLDFSDEFNKAIETKQVVEQQTEQAKIELEKAKVENEKNVESAKAQAEVMREQNSQVTDNTLRLKELEVKEKAIEKWDGKLPSTMTQNLDAILKN